MKMDIQFPGGLWVSAQFRGFTVATLARNQARQATGWLVCESCSSLFLFDRELASQYAIQQLSQPPRSGPATGTSASSNPPLPR